MRKFLLVLLFGVLLIVSACGDTSQNNDNNDNPNNEVNDSNDQNNDQNNDIGEETKFIEGNIFNTFVENTKSESNYEFQASLDLGNKIHEKNYVVYMWEEFDGVIYMRNQYGYGDVIEDSSLRYGFYRIEHEKTTAFENIFNSYVPSGLTEKKEMTTDDFLQVQYPVFDKIISNQFLDILSNATAYREDIVEDETNYNPDQIKHYKIKNSSFTFEDLIFYDWFSDKLNYNDIDKSELIYDVYIDVDNNRVMSVNLDLSEYLLNDQNEKFILEYSYSDFGESKIGLPLSYNYYSKPTEELINNFTSILTDAVQAMLDSSNFAFTTSEKGEEEAKYGNGVSLIDNVKNYYFTDDEEFPYYINFENVIDYAYTIEDGLYYKYLLFPEDHHNYPDQVIKQSISESEFIEDLVNPFDYMPTINQEKLKSYQQVIGEETYTIYQTSVSGSHLLKNNPVYKQLIDNRYADKYGSEIKPEGTYNIDDVFIEIKYIFDTETHELLEINMNLEELISEMVELDRYEINNFNFKVKYNCDSQFASDKSFMDNARFDQEADTFYPMDELKSINKGSEISGSSELYNDKDFFYLNIEEDNNFTIDVSQSNYNISIYDSEQNLIIENTGSVTIDLSAGDYYLCITTKSYETTDYTVIVQ